MLPGSGVCSSSRCYATFRGLRGHVQWWRCAELSWIHWLFGNNLYWSSSLQESSSTSTSYPVLECLPPGPTWPSTNEQQHWRMAQCVQQACLNIPIPSDPSQTHQENHAGAWFQRNSDWAIECWNCWPSSEEGAWRCQPTVERHCRTIWLRKSSHRQLPSSNCS